MFLKLLLVEESNANDHMKNVFSTSFRGRRRTIGQYHNQGYHNQHWQYQWNSHIYQVNAFASRVEEEF